jgi:hypothetical protein
MSMIIRPEWRIYNGRYGKNVGLADWELSETRELTTGKIDVVLKTPASYKTEKVDDKDVLDRFYDLLRLCAEDYSFSRFGFQAGGRCVVESPTGNPHVMQVTHLIDGSDGSTPRVEVDFSIRRAPFDDMEFALDTVAALVGTYDPATIADSIKRFRTVAEPAVHKLFDVLYEARARA